MSLDLMNDNWVDVSRLNQGDKMDCPLDTTYGLSALGVGDAPDTSRIVTEEHSVELENPAHVPVVETKTLLTDYTFSVVYNDGIWVATANRRGTSDTISICFTGNYGAGDAAIVGINKLKELINDC